MSLRTLGVCLALVMIFLTSLRARMSCATLNVLYFITTINN